eukprot:TRINITY_DN3431_c0_g2_i1.p1 TRINITY_DN3431_c0_g2~~TRINITY_DN3431_c0_g2_i1.p1  ORF type:complete len:764 (-),score=153.72 TRINITY_DN3431_c0_g2_i1:418-2709(-)
MARKGPPVKPWVVIAFGLFCIAAGLIASLGIINPLIDEAVQERLVVDDVTKPGFEQWETNTNKDDESQYFEFYFWNLTNADKVRQGENPVVQKVGPFIYERLWKKFDVTIDGEWNSYLFWVNFKEFVPEDTSKYINATTTKITNINFAYMGVLALTGNDENIVIPLTGPLLKRNIDILSGYVLTYNTPSVLQDQYSRLLEIETPQSFRTEWANGTYAADPLWESYLPSVVLGAPTNISEESVNLLFDPNVLGSFTNLDPQNVDAIQSWFRFSAADQQTLKTTFLLDDKTVVYVRNWLVNYRDMRVWPKVRKDVSSTQSIKEKLDLGYIQYGQGSLLGGAFSNTIFPSEKLNGAMEYRSLPQSAAAPLSLPTCQYLFADPLVGIFNPEQFTIYMALAATQNFTAMAARYRITTTQAQLHTLFISGGAVQQNSVFFRFTRPYLAELYAKGGDLFTTHTVEEWLFGYNDPLLAELRPSRNPIFIFNKWETEEQCRQYYKDGDKYKKTTANNGGKDFRRFNEFREVDGKSTLEYWVQPEPIRGTDGLQFSPDLDRNAKHTIWFPEYGRAVDMESSYKSYSVKSIKVDRYVLPESLFSPNSNYYQSIPGFINLTERYDQTTLFASQPYMYGVSSMYTSKVNGQNPLDGKGLGTYADVEPVTGATLRARRQLQLNIYLRDGSSGTPIFSPTGINRLVPVDTFYPSVYIDGGSEVSDARADELNDTLFRALSWSRALLITLTTVGSILVFVASVYWGYKKYRMKGSYESF